MFFTLTKSSFSRNTLFLLIAVLFFSCQKELSIDSGFNTVQPPDLTTTISSSVTGFVTDENNAPVSGAVVQFGTRTTTTDKYGYFEARNVQVVKNAAFVTVSMPGYFKGIKTYIAKAGKSAFFRIKLIPKTNVGSISGTGGGTVTLTSGLKIDLPAGAVVNAATHAAYTGNVSVAAYLISADAADLDRIMPGDLRGINSDGALKLLQTYGMAAVELTGASGELLQIANGKKATLSLPIPVSLLANAPSSIPLWYFDENNGLWKEEGSAVKTGSNYVGEVSHFSYWNCDYPFPNAVQFDCTLVNPAGNPIPGAEVWIYYSNGQYTGCHGTTDSTGYAGGSVPANSQLVMKVIDFNCPTLVLYTQAFTTTNSNMSLGNITIPASSSATISGTLLNCSNQPVTNGYLMLNLGGTYTRYNVNSTGNFNINAVLCGASNSAAFIGGDNTSGQEGTPVNVTLTPGNNNIGNIIACGNSNQEFMNYTVNGTPVSITPAVGGLYQTPDSMALNTLRVYGYISSGPSFISLGINNTGIAPGSTQSLTLYTDDITGQTTIPVAVSVHITEYGSIGQFIAGNFSGSVTGAAPPNTVYTVTCNFRFRRNY